MATYDKPALLVLVRHGESAMNVAKRNNIYLPEDTVDSVRDLSDDRIPLTDNGHNQAQQAGVTIKRIFGLFDFMYHSNYLRTIQTLDGIKMAFTPNELKAVKVRHNHLIRERENGYTFNMTTAEAEQYFPWLKDYWKVHGPFYSRPPGGQSQADKCDDVARFIEHLRRYRAGKKVLVVTHGHTLRAFRYNLEGWTPDEYARSMKDPPFMNCGITAYRLKGDGKMALEILNF